MKSAAEIKLSSNKPMPGEGGNQDKLFNDLLDLLQAENISW